MLSGKRKNESCCNDYREFSERNYLHNEFEPSTSYRILPINPFPNTPF